MTTTRGQHLIGQVIGSYILEKLLGYGGSSAVFLAQNQLTHEKVAVKIFLSRSTMDKQGQKNFYRRFLREAEATSELDHPNILTIYSYGQYNGLPYIVMPYMSGGTLSEYVHAYGPLPLIQAVQYLEQIASALDYAHENGRVHCDVKPANILLESQEHVVLSDFGIVQHIQPNGQNVEPSMRSPDTLMGTPDYVSPEQALGEPLDGRSDIYSLAVTLFFLLAGRLPFQADSSITMALMHVHDTPPPLSTFRSDITPQIDRVIAKALSKWPEDRYQTAGMFSRAFAEAVANAENYVLTASEARMKAIISSGGAKEAKAPSIHTAQVNPTWKYSNKVWRSSLLLILVLAIIIGSTLSVYFVNKFTNANYEAKSAPVSPVSSPTDYLSDNNAWPIEKEIYFFMNGQYHIKNKSPDVATAFYNSGNNLFANFRLTITTTEVHGSFDRADYYGIIFRSSIKQNSYYFFEIDTCCGTGLYELLYYNGQSKQKAGWKTMEYGSLTSPSSNLSKTNVITIVAKGSTFEFFVNDKRVGKQITDHSGDAFLSGEIGLGVEEQNTEVAFSQLHIVRL
jgi:eukaryotic-like serine/threonine-protein kinase